MKIIRRRKSGLDCEAELDAATFYEITDDVELPRTYYELFKQDHVCNGRTPLRSVSLK